MFVRVNRHLFLCVIFLMGVMECYAFIIYSPDSLFNGQEIGHLISMVYYKEVKQLEE